jgi:4'-phosphopantetheinyl transferase
VNNMNDRKVCIYWCDIKNLEYSDKEIEECEIITQTKTIDYLNRIDVIRHITGLLLSEWAINHYGSRHEKQGEYEGVAIGRDGNGKPYYITEKKYSFNISHSGDIAICAISECLVGIDIERKGGTINDILQRICKKEEFEWANSGVGKEKCYSLWTYRESYLKCIGNGIKGIANLFSMIDDKKLIVEHEGFFFYPIQVQNGYESTICTQGPIEWWSVEEVEHDWLKEMLRIIKKC